MEAEPFPQQPLQAEIVVISSDVSVNEGEIETLPSETETPHNEVGMGNTVGAPPTPLPSASSSSLSDVVVGALPVSEKGKNESDPLPYEQMPNLAARLGDAVRCTICNQSPLTPYFQCSRAHLMCASCYQVRLQDRSLGQSLGTCATCHVRIYRQESLRNHVAEKTNEQMPVSCEYCHVAYKGAEIQKHLEKSCPEVPKVCKFSILGCKWRGPRSQLTHHESSCPIRELKGADVYVHADLHAEQMYHEDLQMELLEKMLQRKHVIYRVLQTAPLGNRQLSKDEWYNVSSLHAFEHDWSLKFKWQTSYPMTEPQSGHENEACSRIMYKLKLESYPKGYYLVHFMLVAGTFSEIKPVFETHACEFSRFNRSCNDCIALIDTPEKCEKILRNGLFLRVMLAVEQY